MENFTIPAPNGTTNHGNPNLICTPTSWFSLFIFFATNYLAHAVTVKQLPGEQTSQYIFVVLAAVFFPYCGLPRAIESITRRAIFFRGSELQTACRAGALCVVVRSHNWKPARGQRPMLGVHLPPIEKRKSSLRNSQIGVLTELDDLEQCEASNSSAASRPIILSVTQENLVQCQLPLPSAAVEGHNIQGAISLPPGYELAILPKNTRIIPDANIEAEEAHISSSYNLAQVIVSLVQLISSSITLYRTRGDQLSQYGYAAFGFTVLPYITMSIINFVGNMVTPNYQSLYLVKSVELEEAEARGGAFDGTIGKIIQRPNPTAEGYNRLATFHPGSASKRFTVDISDPTSDGNEASQTWTVWDKLELEKWEDEKVGLVKDHGKFPYMDILSGASAKRYHDDPQSLVIPRCSHFEISGEATTNNWLLTWLGYAIFLLLPYAVIGGLTRFHKGGSTSNQRTWIMMWLASDTSFGYWLLYPSGALSSRFLFFFCLLSLAIPAAIGLVIVGQMLKQYGNCLDIDSGI